MELEVREMVDAILYVLRTGREWTNLPNDYPNANSVYYYCQDGVSTARGAGSTEPCANKCANKNTRSGTENPNQPEPSSTAKASRPPRPVARAATTPERASGDASAT